MSCACFGPRRYSPYSYYQCRHRRSRFPQGNLILYMLRHNPRSTKITTCVENVVPMLWPGVHYYHSTRRHEPLYYGRNQTFLGSCCCHFSQLNNDSKVTRLGQYPKRKKRDLQQSVWWRGRSFHSSFSVISSPCFGL